jgi:hypothetical protein
LPALVCMRCGAPLEVPERDAAAESRARRGPIKSSEPIAPLRCPACGAVHASEAPPRSLPQPDQPDLRPLDPREPVIAEWGGLWWRAELIEAIEPLGAPELWRVRYLGWSDEFAQELGRDRVVELSGGGAPLKRWKWVLVGVGVAVIAATGVLLANKGQLVQTQTTAVEPTTPLSVGQAIEIERDGTWVAGEVLDVRDDGSVFVRYLDRGPIGDEPVPRTRLRLP